MEKLFMSASIVVFIVLCVVGIAKLPFKKLKEKRPNLYKAIFTIFSIVVATVLCVLDEWYILYGSLLSFDFAILLCAVFAGVFGGYSGIYEGLGLKELIKKLTYNLSKLSSMSKDKKIEKTLKKVVDVDKAISILEEIRNQRNSEV